jgi:hypothetical protein
MEKLDIEALLDKNPQVDREAIKARRARPAKEEARTPLKGGDPASPYGGRRVITDDKMRWPATIRKVGQR